MLKGLTGRWRKAVVRGVLLPEGCAATEGYPAFFPDEEAPEVEVMLFESTDLPRHWARLDAFEGPGYRRTAIIARADGIGLSAWIYGAASEP